MAAGLTGLPQLLQRPGDVAVLPGAVVGPEHDPLVLQDRGGPAQGPVMEPVLLGRLPDRGPRGGLVRLLLQERQDPLLRLLPGPGLRSLHLSHPASSVSWP